MAYAPTNAHTDTHIRTDTGSLYEIICMKRDKKVDANACRCICVCVCLHICACMCIFLPDNGRGMTPILAVPAQFPAAQMCVRKKARARATLKERFSQLLSNLQRKRKNAGIRTGANASIFSCKHTCCCCILQKQTAHVFTQAHSSSMYKIERTGI